MQSSHQCVTAFLLEIYLNKYLVTLNTSIVNMSCIALFQIIHRL